MRFVTAAVLLVMAVTLAPTSADAKLSFGGFSCPLIMPCSQADAAFPSTDRIISVGNACITRNMTSSVTGGSFFNDGDGLDSSGCLSTNDSAFPAGNNRTIAHCCITQIPSGQCTLACNVFTP